MLNPDIFWNVVEKPASVPNSLTFINTDNHE